MKLIKSTITALGLLFTVTACAGNKESKNQNMKGENMEIKGIDVSAHQGKINWDTVANYGIDFAILRITEVGNVIDSQFENNFSGCNKGRLCSSAYCFTGEN